MANAPSLPRKTAQTTAAQRAAGAAKAWTPPPAPPQQPLPPAMPLRWACAWGEDEHGLWQAFEVAGVRQVMRWIPPGEFWMGSPATEPERYDNETRHHVVLTQGFWLGDTACTQALWQAVLGENPSQIKGDPEYPVEHLCWSDVTERFLPELNRLAPGLEACLPTEAQWEYGCRAGTETPFWFGEQIAPEQVNYRGTIPYNNGPMGEWRHSTVAVKALPANGWGLYQMHGNVWEWCADLMADYPTGMVTDPSGPQLPSDEKFELRGRPRTLRGSFWGNDGRWCRSAARLACGQYDRRHYTGFRLARGPC